MPTHKKVARLASAAIFSSLLAIGSTSYAANNDFFDLANALYGKGTHAESVEAIKQGAEHGDADAMMLLGYLYFNGQGIQKDYAEAAKWFRQAAEAGIPDAQTWVGYLHKEGKGVPKDYVEAVKWYRMAAEQGLPNAQNHMSLMYYNGEGVAKDYAEAACHLVPPCFSLQPEHLNNYSSFTKTTSTASNSADLASPLSAVTIVAVPCAVIAR